MPAERMQEDCLLLVQNEHKALKISERDECVLAAAAHCQLNIVCVLLLAHRQGYVEIISA